MAQDTGIDPVRLLRELIRRPSVTPEPSGVMEVLEAALRPLGFAIERLRFSGDGSYPVDNLFATRRGAGNGPHLLFGGHTDVVPPGDLSRWTHDPFAAEIADGVLYGRGAADMKSGVAAFVAAAAGAVADGSADRGTISLAITNDEEADSVNGTDKLMAWATAEGHRFDFAIVGEPSAAARAGDSIKLGRRGSLNGRITVTGKQGHAAYPDRANNPVPVAAALVGALSGPLDGGTAGFPPTNLEVTSFDVGNAASNVIPGAATLRFNVRFNDGWTAASLAEHLRARIAGLDARGTEIAFEVVGRPSNCFLSPLGGGAEALIRTIERQTGSGPELSTGGGTSDARFIAQYCPVVECGLHGPTLHQTDECVRIDEVQALTALYRAFIADYFA
jgi:succinyl-diaminopimelate desuccinylase